MYYQIGYLQQFIFKLIFLKFNNTKKDIKKKKKLSKKNLENSPENILKQKM